jgi:hypothetical protein
LDTVPELLRENGVHDASDVKPQTVDQLGDATQNGDPAIASVKRVAGKDKQTGQPITEGHAVTVEKVVTNPDGSRSVVYSDPATGTRQSVPESDFNKEYNGYAITTNPQTPSP